MGEGVAVRVNVGLLGVGDADQQAVVGRGRLAPRAAAVGLAATGVVLPFDATGALVERVHGVRAGAEVDAPVGDQRDPGPAAGHGEHPVRAAVEPSERDDAREHVTARRAVVLRGVDCVLADHRRGPAFAVERPVRFPVVGTLLVLEPPVAADADRRGAESAEELAAIELRHSAGKDYSAVISLLLSVGAVTRSRAFG